MFFRILRPILAGVAIFASAVTAEATPRGSESTDAPAVLGEVADSAGRPLPNVRVVAE